MCITKILRKKKNNRIVYYVKVKFDWLDVSPIIYHNKWNRKSKIFSNCLANTNLTNVKLHYLVNYHELSGNLSSLVCSNFKQLIQSSLIHFRI